MRDDGRQTKDGNDKAEGVENKYWNDEIRNQNDEKGGKQWQKMLPKIKLYKKKIGMEDNKEQEKRN